MTLLLTFYFEYKGPQNRAWSPSHAQMHELSIFCLPNHSVPLCAGSHSLPYSRTFLYTCHHTPIQTQRLNTHKHRGEKPHIFFLYFSICLPIFSFSLELNFSSQWLLLQHLHLSLPPQLALYFHVPHCSYQNQHDFILPNSVVTASVLILLVQTLGTFKTTTFFLKYSLYSAAVTLHCSLPSSHYTFPGPSCLHSKFLAYHNALFFVLFSVLL